MRETDDENGPMHGTVVAVAEIPPLLCSIGDAGRLLGGLSERAVYRLLDADEFETVPVGGRRMVLVESITAYIERRRRAKTP